MLNHSHTDMLTSLRLLYLAYVIVLCIIFIAYNLLDFIDINWLLSEGNNDYSTGTTTGDSSSSANDLGGQKGNNPGPNGPDNNPTPVPSTGDSSSDSSTDESEDSLCGCGHGVGEPCPTCAHTRVVVLYGPPATCCLCGVNDTQPDWVCAEGDCDCVGHNRCDNPGLSEGTSETDSVQDPEINVARQHTETMVPNKKRTLDHYDIKQSTPKRVK